MIRPTPLSGFPEWTPAERLVELDVLDTLRRVFELHGYGSLETRAVEPMDQLLRKGEIDKEVYVLRRLHAEDGDAGLGLHFDLTVPFARYVLERAGHLDFPFRRYQIQKVWRGERPQDGRYREFTQADIDVIDRDTLAFHHEVELPLVVLEALAAAPFPPVVMHVNNRKLAEGFYRGVGADEPAVVLRAIDKLDKIGPEKVRGLLTEAGLSDAAAESCLSMASICTPDASFADAVRKLGVTDPLLDEGLEELVRVIDAGAARAGGRLVADLKIARGLDYYTGTVYETVMTGHEDLGSVCSGGRYDSLASDDKTSYPGVGMSIGLSRILGRLLKTGAVTASRSVPTVVLVAVDDEDTRRTSDVVAGQLRARGISTEVAPSAAKFGKQIKHADKRGIPWVWFPGDNTVKDLRTGEQLPADPSTWTPPAADLRPEIRESRQHEESTS
ncbi:MAG: histidyl-tRNA synthetase [Actinomycetota bacterium]|nr:histidyl-tRNA synthetase [Actinomycetota bacterium]